MQVPPSASHARPVTIDAPPTPHTEAILTPAALEFLADLELRFGERRRGLLAERVQRQARFDEGERPDFLPTTRFMREGEWTVWPPPAHLLDRRVEITGPVDRKMMINALNSGADVFMADFEDSLSPSWKNLVAGQDNLRDAAFGTLEFRGPAGKKYSVGKDPAILMVRPRGWHLAESHATFNGAPMSASLFDTGLFLFHCAQRLRAEAAGPYLYLPKLESHHEARLWHDVLCYAEARLDLPVDCIRVTVLIETLPAAFEMEEILYELRDRACGLNAGRWDYLFSLIKTFREHSDMVLPSRAQLTMDAPFMRAYADLLVRTCHKRGAHAMGGMAACIPDRDDVAVDRAAVAGVRMDKAREATQGFDGTWVAHPDLVLEARAAFDAVLAGRPNQVDRQPAGPAPGQRELLDLRVPGGRVTMSGLQGDLGVALRYLAAWLDGRGAVVLSHLMEDTATAEIARAQAWQWVRHQTPLEGGAPVTPALVRSLVDAELRAIQKEEGADALREEHYADAQALLLELVLAPALPGFLTVAGAPILAKLEERPLPGQPRSDRRTAQATELPKP